MIVKNGRDAIFNRIVNSIGEVITDDDYTGTGNIKNGYAEYENTMEANIFSHFSKLQFGSGNDMTTPSTESITAVDGTSDTSDINNLYTINLDSADEQDTNGIQVFMHFTNTVEYRRMEFEITLAAVQPAEITELGLFYKNTNGDENLFSRVVFDPIFCGPNASITELKLNYYIYF
jgi:hypothetical protein